MFEKEAEKYLKAFTDRSYIWSNDKLMQLQLREAYKNGAEFGYNKANEWHDLRKNPNDLPKDTDSLYLVRVYTWDSNLHDFYKKYSFHIPTVCYWNGKRFIALDNMAYSNAISDSIAWKEIVSPKEDEIESEMFPEIILPEGSSEFIDKVIADAEKRVKEKNK